jgi:beta-galactosidase
MEKSQCSAARGDLRSARIDGPSNVRRGWIDRAMIAGDGKDLSYITITVADADKAPVPRSANLVHVQVDGPGQIVATDNGDPTDLTVFPSHDRKVFHGLAWRSSAPSPGTAARSS